MCKNSIASILRVGMTVKEGTIIMAHQRQVPYHVCTYRNAEGLPIRRPQPHKAMSQPIWGGITCYF
jgi:hypothetical protein